jgi:hypothetical protein
MAINTMTRKRADGNPLGTFALVSRSFRNAKMTPTKGMSIKGAKASLSIGFHSSKSRHFLLMPALLAHKRMEMTAPMVDERPHCEGRREYENDLSNNVPALLWNVN